MTAGAKETRRGKQRRGHRHTGRQYCDEQGDDAQERIIADRSGTVDKTWTSGQGQMRMYHQPGVTR